MSTDPAYHVQPCDVDLSYTVGISGLVKPKEPAVVTDKGQRYLSNATGLQAASSSLKSLLLPC